MALQGPAQGFDEGQLQHSSSLVSQGLYHDYDDHDYDYDEYDDDDHNYVYDDYDHDYNDHDDLMPDNRCT